MNLSTEKKIMDMENRRGCQGRGGRSRMDWEFGVGVDKQNEILLYSMGNYIQSLVMEHDGG